MKLKLTNNAETLLAGAIDEDDTVILLAPGTGAQFPQIEAGEFFPMTLVKSANGIPGREIVFVTARDGDSCTVLRGQEGTTAQPFATGDYAGCHPTAKCFEVKMDTAGGTFSGPVDMANNKVTQAVLQDCAVAFKDNLAATVIDIANGPAQRWAPAAGAQTLSIVGWPPAGNHAELLLYGVDLGKATITLDGQPVNFKNDDRTYTRSNNLSTNHGAVLPPSGEVFILFWSADGGVNRYCRVL